LKSNQQVQLIIKKFGENFSYFFKPFKLKISGSHGQI
jgi:hypothetical protein